ncbi:MAG: DUF2894 domain-containing protein [Marinobacter sp.]|nr:DUF2894 domain-containing protein [Marinobacter sp.]
MTDASVTPLAALIAADESSRNPVQRRYLQGLAERAARCRHAALRTAVETRLKAVLQDGAQRHWPALSASTPTGGVETVSTPGRAGLRALLGQLDSRDTQPVPDEPSLTNLMQQQAMAALQQHSGLPPDSLQAGSASGLRAAASLQPERNRQHVAQLLAAIADQLPPDAGPLNSQRLFVKALQTLQDTAPAYLQHLLTQLETLQWLEQAEPPQKR